jgi:hypothetical protein
MDEFNASAPAFLDIGEEEAAEYLRGTKDAKAAHPGGNVAAV